MVSCKAIRAVIVSDLSRWKRDRRVWFVFLATALLLQYYIQPFVSYGLDWGRTAPLCMLPVLFHSSTISISTPKILFHIGLLLLLCDAPFFYPSKPYLLIRCGKKNWWIGECLYIVIVAFLYTGFLALVSSLLVLPVCSLQDSWGGILMDLEMGNEELTNAELVLQYPHMVLPVLVIRYLYPSGAQLYTFLTVWGSFSILGLLMYLVSLISRNVVWGFLLSGILVFLDPILNWFSWPNHYWLQMLSPVCWTSVEQLDLLQAEHVISIPYIAGMSLFLLFLLLFLIRKAGKTVNLDTFKEGSRHG